MPDYTFCPSRLHPTNSTGLKQINTVHWQHAVFGYIQVSRISGTQISQTRRKYILVGSAAPSLALQGLLHLRTADAGQSSRTVLNLPLRQRQYVVASNHQPKTPPCPWTLPHLLTSMISYASAPATLVFTACSTAKALCCISARQKTSKTASPAISKPSNCRRKPPHWLARSPRSNSPSLPAKPRRCCWSKR